MAGNIDGSSPDSEAAANRRWLITIVITVLFGGFGAVMAYLSYASSNKPSAPSTGSSKPPATSPSTAPATQPAAPEPSGDDNEHKGKPDKDN